MATDNSFLASFLLLLLLLHLCLQHDLVEATETSIGSISSYNPPAPTEEHNDCGCLPAPPPPCSPQLSPPPPLPPPPPPPVICPLSPPPLHSPPPPPPPPLAPVPAPNDRLEIAFKVIMRFKKLIGSDPYHITDTWVGNDPCNFRGFTCDFVPGYDQRGVSGVDFNGKLLGGKKVNGKDHLPLEGFLNELPDLVFFHANSNNFTDNKLPDTSKLPYFYELDVSNNKLCGSFPYDVLRATNLTFLDLRFNNFQGSVPPQVFSLDVDVLFLNNNQFDGQIHDAIGSSPAHYLTFANNHFSGPIPKAIGNACKSLYEVLFLNNKLSGCLPWEIGRLDEATLFDVSYNSLTGQIPQSFACLAKMEILVLDSNQFYGEVPEMVCNLPNLKNLSLTNNYFTEVGPACRKLINKGFLNVKNNCIPNLKDQKSKSDCSTFVPTARTCRNNEGSIRYPRCTGHHSSEKKLEPHGLASAPLSYGALTPHNS